MRKRAHNEIATFKTRKFVYMLGVDDLNRPVYVDMQLLRHYGCRTQKSIDNGDTPLYTDSNGPVYVSWMSREMLVCFITSLTVGKMIISDSVSYRQAVAMFEYEAICVPSALDAEALSSASYSIKCQHEMGVGMNKRHERVIHTVSRLAESISHAIIEWPRLDHGLEFSITEEDPVDSGATVGFSCSPTRCWIRFADPPSELIEHATDPTYTLCKKRPYWLAMTLYAIGSVHSRLVSVERIGRDDRSEAAFFVLEHGTKNDLLMSFISARVDIPRAWRERAKRTLGEAEKFAISILSEVTLQGPFRETDKISTSCKYARACVALALKLALSTPKIATIFESKCDDEKGATPERDALAKALRLHKIKIVRWGQYENALVFPPCFRNTPHVKSDGPCVLLSFEALR